MVPLSTITMWEVILWMMYVIPTWIVLSFVVAIPLGRAMSVGDEEQD